jgi:hypothetical protein
MVGFRSGFCFCCVLWHDAAPVWLVSAKKAKTATKDILSLIAVAPRYLLRPLP